MLRLSFITDLMYSKKKTIVIYVQFLEQTNVIFNLLK